jgi:sugar phosphate isomerase/epimerase
VVIGVAAWHLGNLPLAERVRWVAANGFTAVSLLDRELVAEGPRGLDREAEEELRRSGLGIAVHMSCASWDDPGQEALFRLALGRAAALARETGRVSCIGSDPVNFREKGSVVYDPDGTLAALEIVARAVEGLEVAVAVETWRINPEPEEFVRLASGLEGTELGILLDLGHVNLMTDDPPAAVAELRLPVYEVHLSDNCGDSDDHLPLGRGTVPLDDCVRELVSKGFDGVWTLEFRPAYRQEEGTIENPRAVETILDSKAKLEKAVARCLEDPRP